MTPEDLLELHERRGQQILSAAVANGAQVIILGAFGCGAFKNDPAVVAQAYANILPEYLHYFRTIEFAVYCRPHSPQNFDEFKNFIV
ncbi:MAG: TIGR02452 family protein [Bacteroidales bacterium]|nr:TIGR02452 family protein [Bacteroidales bacterium]